MLEQITYFFMSRPTRMIALGQTLLKAGIAIIGFALLANIGTSAMEIIVSLNGQLGTDKSLAEIYPTLPTWWIPESFIGTVPAIMLVIAGLWLNATGEQINRYIRCIS